MPGPLADWGQRASGILIDIAICIVPVILAIIFVAAKVAVLGVLMYLVIIGLEVWFAVQVGTTGQSPGMRVVGLKCVSTTTGQPIGAGMGIVRWICHVIDGAICYIGWLFPLWDQKRQTIADKIVSTVVVTVPKQGFSLT
jgi:uncharacterized RDD family membrane protein YckC